MESLFNLLDDYYVSIFLIFILFVVVYYFVNLCTSSSKRNNTIENFYSKCCPPDYPDLVFDWKNKATCYNPKNDLGTDPIPNCLPPNFLKKPFNRDQKPRNYIF
jgi:hypothetical protein